jgi:hypothetical protein
VTDVAGAQPAVAADDGGGLVEAPQIAAHDVGSADHDLAVLSGHDSRAEPCEDAQFLAGERNVRRCLPCVMPVDGVDRRAAGGFGQSVALDEREPEAASKRVSSSAEAGAAPQTAKRPS